MGECRRIHDLMAEALYDDLGPGDREVFETHLRTCRRCAEKFREMKETLTVIAARTRPEPSPEFWDGYWDRLAARMEREAAQPAAAETLDAAGPPRPSLIERLRARFATVPRWAIQAAAAAVLISLGIFIGRGLMAPPAPGPGGSLTTAGAGQTGDTRSGLIIPAADDPFARRAGDYIAKSKVLLLALVNYDPATDDPYGLNLPLQKTVSRELLTEAAWLKSRPNGADARLRGLINDLEVILLQIANLESEQDLDAVEFVKQGVDERGVLLKINLSQMGPTPGQRRSGASDPKGTPSPDPKTL